MRPCRLLISLLTVAVLSTSGAAGELGELDVPLTICDVAGVERKAEVCSTGIPLPHGLLQEPKGIAVFGPNGKSVPAQFRVLERWRDKGTGQGDESIKFLLVTFLADVSAGKVAVYRLKAGENPAPASPAKVEKKGAGYVLNGLEFAPDLSAPFKAVLTTPEGEEICASELPLRWSVWEEGPIRACIKAENVTVPGKYGLIAYIYSYAGQQRYDLSITLKNTPNKQVGPLYFRDFSVIWAPPELANAADFHLFGEGGKATSGRVETGKPAYLYQASDGTAAWNRLSDPNGRQWQRAFTLRNAAAGVPKFRGYRVVSGRRELSAGNFALGCGVLSGEKGSAFAAVRHFLHQYPKAMEVDSGNITVRLWPKYYQGYGGMQWLDDCTKKTHEISFVLSDSQMSAEEAVRLAKAFDAPLMAFAGVDWTRKTGVRGYISERYKDTGSEIGHVFRPSMHNWLTWGAPPDRSRRRYSGYGLDGWLKTGDMAQAYMLRRYMLSSTGITPFFVDEYTYPEGKDLIRCPTAYMQPPRKRGTYRKGTASHGYNAWNDQHFCSLELFDGWRLFGEPLALDSLKKVGVFTQFYVDYRKENKTNNPRKDSFPWQNLTEAYRITGDEAMLESIKAWEKLAWENQIDKARGIYAWKSVAPDFYVFVKAFGKPVEGMKKVAIGESWPHNSLTDALRYSYRVTGNENMPGMIMGITGYLLEEGFAGWPGGFTYKMPLDPGLQERMKEVYRKNGAWSLRESLPTLAWAYLHTGEKRYKDLFMAPVKEFQKSARFARMVSPGGWRTTGVHYDWSNMADQALEDKRTDHEPPATVMGLKAEALGGGRVRLTWTCPPGDPVRYQVKWADKLMVWRIKWPEQKDTHSNWWAANNVEGEPEPAAAGTSQSMVVEGVTPGTRYFAIRAFDASNNRSAISNQPKVNVR